MANKEIKTRIRLKYDTEANWTSKNPTLLSGEMAISSDKNGQFKTGNGTSTWSQLAYNQVPWTSVTGRPTTLKNPSALTIQFNGVTNVSYIGDKAQTVNITPAAIGAATTKQLSDLKTIVDQVITPDAIDGGDLMDSGPAANTYDGGTL